MPSKTTVRGWEGSPGGRHHPLCIGKIFIYPVQEALHIRTGETGDAAV